MERVVAWPGQDGPGFVNLHWQAPKNAGFRGRPFKNVDEFMNLAVQAANKPGTFKEIYFCTSTQGTTGRVIHGGPTAHRHKNQALWLKALWLDVDIKPEKGYATLAEALAGITAFRETAGLPSPSALVFTGGGLHVYWISDKPLAPEDWLPFAEGLKSEALKLGLKCDAMLIADAARVMRVPGTYNNKLPTARPVKLLHLGQSYDFLTEPGIARLGTIVTIVKKTPATAAVTAQQLVFDPVKFPINGMASAFSGLTPETFGGLSLANDSPLLLGEVVKGCMHFRDSALTHGKAHSEPLWQLTLLASSWFEDGEKWAHYFSKGYPTYSHAETQAKYEQKIVQKAQGNLGWPSCSAFEAAGAKCKTCPFYQKLRSPLNLAQRSAPVVMSVVIPPSVDDDLDLPDGYALNGEGLISEIVTKEDNNGNQYDEYKPLFMCQLRNPVALSIKRGLRLETSLDMDNWGEVILHEVDMSTEQTCIKQLRTYGVKPWPKNQNGIIHFMTSWLKRLDSAKARTKTVPFGWVREGGTSAGNELGFAYGGKMFKVDGTVGLAGVADPQIEPYYRPRGNAKVWHECLALITVQHRADLEAIIAMSFGAPLLSLIGKNNVVGCAWSNGSGAHKSTAQYVGLAVWGNPRMTKESPMSSKKGIIHKLGQLNNLPLYWDEISDPDKMQQVFDLLGIATEGKGGSLLRQDRNFYDTDEWQTLMMVGANQSLIQFIMERTKSTDAQMQRVFEFEVQKRPMTQRESDVTILINSLEYNYGSPGLAYSAYLGANVAAVKKQVLDNLHRFEDTVQHQSEERFRAAMAVCMYTGAEIANQVCAATFNLEELWTFLVDTYTQQRGVIVASDITGGTVNNTVNAMTAFLKENTQRALWIMSTPKQSGRAQIAYIAGPRADRPLPVHVRLAVLDRTIEVSTMALGQFCTTHGWSLSALVSGLENHFGAKRVKGINLAAGAQVLGGPEAVLRIPVPDNSPFREELYRHTPAEERPPVTAPVTEPVPEALAAGAEQAAKDLDKVKQTSA